MDAVWGLLWTVRNVNRLPTMVWNCCFFDICVKSHSAQWFLNILLAWEKKSRASNVKGPLGSGIRALDIPPDQAVPIHFCPFLMTSSVWFRLESPVALDSSLTRMSLCFCVFSFPLCFSSLPCTAGGGAWLLLWRCPTIWCPSPPTNGCFQPMPRLCWLKTTNDV